MDGPFDSAWLKWAMGVVNAEVLQNNVNALASQGKLKVQFGLSSEYDAKRHCVSVGVAQAPQLTPDIWGLLLGDTVHGLRSALDHLAWALYKRGHTPNLPRRQEQGVYFPIARTPDQFKGWVTGKRPKLPGVRSTDLAIVRRYQPYLRGQRNLYRHPLIVLDDLSIADKHQVIQPVQLVPESARYNISFIKDCEITRIAPRVRPTPFEPNTELARFYVRKTGPEPEIHVEPEFSVNPAVTERVTLQEWGLTTPRFIAMLLSEFAQPPESVRAMLANTSHGASPAWLPSTPK